MSKRIKKKEKKQEIQHKKIELLIIFKCNCRCIMCSTGNQIDRSINDNNYKFIKPFDEVIKDIDKVKELNIEGVAFSGGEPTLRSDLPDLANYARKIGIPRIEIQSNGRMYSYKEYCKKLIDNGVNDFVVSFHSCYEKTQDKMMGVKGAYRQLLEGMKNLESLGQELKVNMVLTRFNYDHLKENVDFLSKMNVIEVRFIMGTVEGNACDDPRGIVAPMTKVSPYLVKALDLAHKKNIMSFVYNMVPCVMPTHVGYINDMGQLDTILIGPDFEASLDDNKRSQKTKSKTCADCKYNQVCHGIWKEYIKIFGTNELRPIK